MTDALAIVLPFAVVSAPLLKVLAYSQKHNRPSQGWFVAMVAGSLALLSIIGLRYFHTFDFNITLLVPGLALFAAGVILRPLALAAEMGDLKLKWFYPVVLGLAIAFLTYVFPDGFYGYPEAYMVWIERFFVATSWVGFAALFARQDGLDGNVALMTVFIGFGLAMMAKGVALFAMILIGCSLGFMRFNHPPAKVTMGFTGSFWLGFILAGLAIMSLMPHPLSNADCLSLLTLMLYPLADSLQAGLATWRNKKPFDDNLWAGRLLGGGIQPVNLLIRCIFVHFLLFFLSILGYVAHQSLYTLLFGALLLALHHVNIKRLCEVKVKGPTAQKAKVGKASQGKTSKPRAKKK